MTEAEEQASLDFSNKLHIDLINFRATSRMLDDLQEAHRMLRDRIVKCEKNKQNREQALIDFLTERLFFISDAFSKERINEICAGLLESGHREMRIWVDKDKRQQFEQDFKKFYAICCGTFRVCKMNQLEDGRFYIVIVL